MSCAPLSLPQTPRGSLFLIDFQTVSSCAWVFCRVFQLLEKSPLPLGKGEVKGHGVFWSCHQKNPGLIKPFPAVPAVCIAGARKIRSQRVKNGMGSFRTKNEATSRTRPIISTVIARPTNPPAMSCTIESSTSVLMLTKLGGILPDWTGPTGCRTCQAVELWPQVQ